MQKSILLNTLRDINSRSSIQTGSSGTQRLISIENKQTPLSSRVPNTIRIKRRQTPEIVSLHLAASETHLDETETSRDEQLSTTNLFLKNNHVIDGVIGPLLLGVEDVDLLEQTRHVLRPWRAHVLEDRVLLGRYEQHVEIVLVFGLHRVDH